MLLLTAEKSSVMEIIAFYIDLPVIKYLQKLMQIPMVLLGHNHECKLGQCLSVDLTLSLSETIEKYFQ